jgi:hypothetical protein
MPLLVASVIKRHLKHSKCFTASGGLGTHAEWPKLDPDEILVGIYRNPSAVSPDEIAFTTKGLHVREGPREFEIPFADLLSFDVPDSKTTASGVRVTSSEGSYFVRLTGTYGPNGKYRDAFSLVSILNAVLRAREEGKRRRR